VTEIRGLIERKKRGEALDADELRALCRTVVDGSVPDYQLAAWLMAVCWRGMDAAETLALTRGMVATGATLDWRDLDRPTVDKHSTGGVGDKTSLVLVPLLAAAGLAFVKMSGRGLGHTGGTLDKLESIPGFTVTLPLERMRAQVRRIGCALVGQSAELVPADGRLYALRDVTATVDCVPLIASSIMSKKLAGGAGAIVLDVKWGAGAFMQSADEARELAAALVGIGGGADRRTRAILSPMSEPLGRAVGNALEVREAIDTLRGGGPPELWTLTRELGSHAMVLAGAAPDLPAAVGRLEALRDSGAAAARLEALIEAQGGDPRVVEEPERLPAAPHRELFTAEGDGGWIRRVDARGVADAALALGAGRRIKTAPVDPAVGVVLRVRTGDRVAAGQPLAAIHARGAEAAAAAVERLRVAISLSDEPVPTPEAGFEIVAGAVA
jgi:pyrimidine-nucleoside phosphorylase